MERQVRETQSNRQKRRKRTTWVRWSVVGAVLLAILVFSVSSLLILRSQGITQATITLTVLYIIIGVVIGLLGLLFTFLQWFHVRHSSIPDTSSLPSPPSLPSSTFQASIPPFQQSALSSTAAIVLSQKLIKDVGTSKQTHEDWGEAPHIVQFYGREKELANLAQWVLIDHCRVVAILGIGGIGKTHGMRNELYLLSKVALDRSSLHP